MIAKLKYVDSIVFCLLKMKKVIVVFNIFEQALVRAGVNTTETNKIFGIEIKGNSTLFNLQLHVYTNYFIVNILSLPDLDSNRKEVHTETDQSTSTSPVEGKMKALDAGQQTSNDVALSVRQLVVRRGLCVLLMFVILAAGVFSAELLTRLYESDE